MCGPTGSLFYTGMGIFGVFFLGLLAILIDNNYPYAGEWFESKPASPGEPLEPLHEQKEAAVHSLWITVGIYGVMAVVGGLAVCTHKLRGRL